MKCLLKTKRTTTHLKAKRSDSMSMKKLFNIGLALGIVLVSAQANLSYAGDRLNGTVSLDGSSTVFPISEAVAEEFGSVQPRVRVTVGVSGTGGGFKKFLAGETDINGASRAIKPKELDKAKDNGIQFIELPVAFDGLSVVVNKDNHWVDQLSVAELKKIWQPGSSVKMWSDVRSGWPSQPVRLYGPGTDSGTFDYFTETINGKSGASRPDYTSSEDDNALVQGIIGDVNAMGYFGFAYYEANKDKLKLVPIDGGKGPISPSMITINNGSYAPLSRPIFMYVREKALDRPEVKALSLFYIENAALLATEVGYIPLPDKAYTRAIERIEKRSVGTSYHSGSAADLLAP